MSLPNPMIRAKIGGEKRRPDAGTTLYVDSGYHAMGM
jgi:hypothetical protein